MAKRNVNVPMGASETISALLADVDGTLVTKAKVLTKRAMEAVHRLHASGIDFFITSGRPPRGMRMLVEPLGLKTPIAAFNGGMMVQPDLSVIDERPLPDDVVPDVINTLLAHGLDVWIYRGTDWYVRSGQAPHVDREAATVQFLPTVVPTFDGLLSRVVKIVGVSDDLDLVARCEAAAQAQFGAHVSAARSQPYYLDVTHPTANKGTVIARLSRFLNVPLESIATIGDQPNDVLMFKPSGLSIAMGNASAEVQRQAHYVTTSSENEGFANAVERFILPRAVHREKRTQPYPIVFLVDVDNTLLENDRLEDDLKRHIEREFGPESRDRFWSIQEELFQQLGYRDYLGALQKYRVEHPTDIHLLQMSSYLVDYPFANRLYPRSLDVLERFRSWGQTVILSDGDVVFQPRKVERSGIREAVDGHVLIYIHKETALDDVTQRYPAEHYVLVDDKLRILTAVKRAWGERVTTVFPRQGKFAHDPAVLAANPPADVTVERIADLLRYELPDLLGTPSVASEKP